MLLSTDTSNKRCQIVFSNTIIILFTYHAQLSSGSDFHPTCRPHFPNRFKAIWKYDNLNHQQVPVMSQISTQHIMNGSPSPRLLFWWHLLSTLPWGGRRQPGVSRSVFGAHWYSTVPRSVKWRHPLVVWHILYQSFPVLISIMKPDFGYQGWKWHSWGKWEVVDRSASCPEATLSVKMTRILDGWEGLLYSLKITRVICNDNVS